MNRRKIVLSSIGAVAAASGLSGAGSLARQATPAASGLQPDGTWTFTDDRGRTITAPETPMRIFADVGAGLALWELGITPVGLCGYSGVFEIPEELADVPFLDLAAGELDVEQVIALDPDLSVCQAWDAENPNDWGGFDETTLPGFTDVAPTLGILAVVAPVDQSLARFEELAAALGADLTTPEVVANRDAFEAACDEVRAAAADKPALTVLAMSAAADGIWIGNPESASDLRFFSELGVTIFVPEAPDAEMSGLWQQVSWEEIANFPADLYLNDDRQYALSTSEVLAQPVFALLPAAEAGQVGAWTIEYIPSYRAMIPILTALAESIRASEVVTG